MRPPIAIDRGIPGPGWRNGYSASIAILLALALAACGRASDSPEARVRSLVTQAAAAAEAKDGATLRGMIHERYSDGEGRDKRLVEAIVRAYLLRHQSIHVFSQIKSISFPEHGRAEVVIVAATAGQPIESAEAARKLEADFFRFEIQFVSDDGKEWKVMKASWRPADFVDLL